MKNKNRNKTKQNPKNKLMEETLWEGIPGYACFLFRFSPGVSADSSCSQSKKPQQPNKRLSKLMLLNN